MDASNDDRQLSFFAKRSVLFDNTVILRKTTDTDEVRLENIKMFPDFAGYNLKLVAVPAEFFPGVAYQIAQPKLGISGFGFYM